MFYNKLIKLDNLSMNWQNIIIYKHFVKSFKFHRKIVWKQYRIDFK